MQLFSIENEFLSLHLTETGSELKHLKSRNSGREWMWQAHPEFWPRTAPVLFPIVGKLAENQYFVDGIPFPLSQHGFARDRVFTCTEHTHDHIRMKLSSDYESRKFYPFDFDLLISHQLVKNWVWIEYEVINTGKEEMYFSIGGHPGFALNGWPEKGWELVFEKEETLKPYLLESGLLKRETGPALPLPNKRLFLDAHLFDRDALVLNDLQSSWIGIAPKDGDPELKVHFSGVPWFGIWAKPGAPFVCLEPWYGHADFTGPAGEIARKPGVIQLEPGQNFHCRYAFEVCSD